MGKSRSRRQFDRGALSREIAAERAADIHRYTETGAGPDSRSLGGPLDEQWPPGDILPIGDRQPKGDRVRTNPRKRRNR